MRRLVRIPAGCLLVIIAAIVSKTQRGIIIADPRNGYAIQQQTHRPRLTKHDVSSSESLQIELKIGLAEILSFENSRKKKRRKM